MESTTERVWAPELALKVSDEMTLGVIRALDQESDLISLTLSRNSITSTALSPVILWISLRRDSSASTSVNLFTSWSKSKPPTSSCFELGRENMISGIPRNITEGERV